jgi:hypothetical protein
LACKYHNYLQLPWTDPGAWNQLSASQQRRAGRVVAHLRYGRSTDGQMLLTELPVQQHRQLPADADITGARLTIRHTPAGLRATLNVSATQPDPDIRRTGATVAMHLGWRRSPDGIVAATWRAIRALRIPAALRAVVIAETARTGRLIVPAALSNAFARADHIRAERGQAARALQRSLVTWLSSHGPIDDPRQPATTLDAATVEQWCGTANLGSLASAWAAHPPAGAESIVALLRRWQRRDAKLRRGPDLGQRRHAAAARDDTYRQFAAMLATQAKVLVIDDLVLPDLTAFHPTITGSPQAHRHRPTHRGTRTATHVRHHRCGARGLHDQRSRMPRTLTNPRRRLRLRKPHRHAIPVRNSALRRLRRPVRPGPRGYSAHAAPGTAIAKGGREDRPLGARQRPRSCGGPQWSTIRR